MARKIPVTGGKKSAFRTFQIKQGGKKTGTCKTSENVTAEQAKIDIKILKNLGALKGFESGKEYEMFFLRGGKRVLVDKNEELDKIEQMIETTGIENIDKQFNPTFTVSQSGNVFLIQRITAKPKK